MQFQKEDFYITTDKTKIDIQYVHQFLSNTYWAKDIPLDTLKRSIEGSICFSVFHSDKQVGFARVITDEATFAYLADVFIDDNYRGQGLSRWLMEVIMAQPSLQGLRRFLLATRDAHGLYEKFGFKRIESAEPWMQIHQTYGQSC
jgi:N-acetylglutamate synthase-like GNAT family acetyltransferase